MLRKALIGSGLVVALLVGAAVFIGPPQVPAEAIASSVNHDPALIAKAWVANKGELYSQSNGSVCGPASLVNVFRALGLPAADESAVLAGTGKCQTGVCFMGLTLDELAEVARKQPRKVTVLRDLDAAQFREHLLHVSDPDRHYIVNFTRKPIFGSGGGHHSPIGGYLPEQDLVLVLDVNKRFQPWLVSRERLFAAVDTVDSSSGKKRGLLLIE